MRPHSLDTRRPAPGSRTRRSRRVRAAVAALLGALLAVALVAVLAGRGGHPGSPGGGAPPERGVCSGPCPYARVAAIGQRGNGVLRVPEAVAFSPSGDVYVADQFSYVIQRFSPDGVFKGQWGSYGKRPGQLGAISGLALDGQGNVYAVDSPQDRVQKFDPHGHLLTSWGRHGRGLGEFNFGGGSGADRPPGGAIAIRGDHVYVADSNNNRIERFDLDGTHPMSFGQVGRGPGQMRHPRAIAVSTRAIYVGDDYNTRIDEFDLQGHFVAQMGTVGKGRGQFTDPYGVTVGPDGNVYVADDNDNRVIRLTPRLAWIEDWRGDGRGRLSYVRGLATDAAGRVYVADSGNNRVVVFDAHGGLVRTWGRSGRTAGQLIGPLAVATDSAGGVLVAETYSSLGPINLYDPALVYRTTWVGGGGAILGHHFFSPTALAVAPDGSVWVNDRQNGVLRHLSAMGRFLGSLGGPGAQAGRLSNPAGLTVDIKANVVVADTDNHRVQRFSALGRLRNVWPLPLGARPVAVAVDRRGDTYVADAGTSRVEKLNPHGTLVRSWGGAGARPGRFQQPSGIAVDPGGDIFVSDLVNDRIQKFSGDGRLLGAWGRDGSARGELSQPAGVTVDCRGDLLVADTKNNRVQIFRGVARATTCVAPGSGWVARAGVPEGGGRIPGHVRENTTVSDG